MRRMTSPSKTLFRGASRASLAFLLALALTSCQLRLIGSRPSGDEASLSSGGGGSQGQTTTLVTPIVVQTASTSDTGAPQVVVTLTRPTTAGNTLIIGVGDDQGPYS